MLVCKVHAIEGWNSNTIEREAFPRIHDGLTQSASRIYQGFVAPPSAYSVVANERREPIVFLHVLFKSLKSRNWSMFSRFHGVLLTSIGSRYPRFRAGSDVMLGDGSLYYEPHRCSNHFVCIKRARVGRRGLSCADRAGGKTVEHKSRQA